MNTTQRALALNAAIVDLEWLIEADRYHNALAVLSDTDAAIAIKAGSTGRIGGRPSTIANPTMDAAMARITQGSIGEGSRKALARCVNDLGETAEHMRTATMRALHDIVLDRQIPWSLTQAHADANWCNTIPHHVNKAIHTWQQIGMDEDANELARAVEHLEREAKWLRSRVGTILLNATQAAQEPRVEQPKVNYCRNHASHGLPSVIAIKHGLCEDCVAFRSRYKCLPTLDILRAWEYGRKSLPAGLIAEAQAKRKVRTA